MNPISQKILGKLPLIIFFSLTLGIVLFFAISYLAFGSNLNAPTQELLYIYIFSVIIIFIFLIFIYRNYFKIIVNNTTLKKITEVSDDLFTYKANSYQEDERTQQELVIIIKKLLITNIIFLIIFIISCYLSSVALVTFHGFNIFLIFASTSAFVACIITWVQSVPQIVIKPSGEWVLTYKKYPEARIVRSKYKDFIEFFLGTSLGCTVLGLIFKDVNMTRTSLVASFIFGLISLFISFVKKSTKKQIANSPLRKSAPFIKIFNVIIFLIFTVVWGYCIMFFCFYLNI